jgi:hypothetical protein
MSQNLESFNHIFNAALEHCPQRTRDIFAAMAQPHITALVEALKQLEKPAAPPAEKSA